jgi:hypothetical protein
VTELVQISRSEAERVYVIADPPQGSPLLGRRDHDWKLATCRAPVRPSLDPRTESEASVELSSVHLAKWQ